MPFKVLAFALPLLAFQLPCQAQPLEKKGLPCVAEICLGDGIAELSKIQWTPAQNSYKVNNKVQLTGGRKLTDDDLRVLKATYPNAGEAAPFLHDKQFDATALATLARVSTACDTNELFGTFGATSDTPTRVGISLKPVAGDPGKQEWIVTTIVREFPSAVTNDDKGVITKMLNKRYAKFGAGNQNIPEAKPGEGRFFPGGLSRFGFGLSMHRASDEASKMKMHPACGGVGDSDKVKAG
jgi:hypothetical protein